MANHYTCTHPDSRFVKILSVSIAAPGRRRILRGLSLLASQGGGPREVAPEDLPALLREGFGLELPEEAFRRFPKTYNNLR